MTFNDRYRPFLLAFIVSAVFANSFRGVFVFDEYSSITRNDGIQHLWPLDCIFSYPNSTRPVIGVSFALNYAISGAHPWSYHVVNLAIHVIATLALYGILLHTFLSERLRARFGRDAVQLAFLIALIWGIHPLQTASVTYVVQRCESLMGMFFILTLYCAIRSASAEDPTRWSIAAILCCALGMGTKQVMVAAPVLTLLYDRMFLSGTIAEAIRLRGRLYVGLFGSCIFLASSVVTNSPIGPSAGFSITCVTPYHYLLTQCAVIPHYLSLTFWPNTLCLDYSWPFTTSAVEVWPGLMLLTGVGLATLIGIIRNATWAYPGAWFFVILAPSSSIMPIQDPIFEHRIYLPLAAVATAVIVLVQLLVRALVARGVRPSILQRATAVFIFAMIAGLSIRTVLRNCDYYSESRIWRKVADLFPGYQRAANNLGNALAVEQQHAEAVHWFEVCEKINPNYADAQFNLGVELNNLGRKEEAVKHYKRALEIDPKYQNANNFMADILVELGRYDEAISHYEVEFKRDPNRLDIKEKIEAARDKLPSD